MGSYIVKNMVIHALDRLLGERKTLTINLPAQGIVTLQEQQNKKRLIQHSLYASPVLRGKKTTLEVIEDILPVYRTEITIKINKEVKNVYLAPQKKDITFRQTNGVLNYTIDQFECHQMVVIDY